MPGRALGQQDKVWRVGFLAARSRSAAVEVEPFLQGMRELGYADGRNVRYEWRFADGKYERLPRLAKELVQLEVDVIAASNTPSVRAAQQSTREIPIVMVSAVDPVRMGFVASLARPGGNITGVSNLSEAVWQKQLDVLLEALPKVSRVAFLLNPDEQFSEAAYKSIAAAAQSRHIALVRLEARSIEAIERAFGSLQEARVQALVMGGGAFFVQQRKLLVDLAAKARVPVMYYRREYVEAGGLMSYGRNAAIGYRRAAAFVDKILKGARPADLPVEQPTAIELVVNRKTAEALGVTFPPQLLLRADKVIE